MIGSGGQFILTFLDEHFKPDMTLGQCSDLAVKACTLAMNRDNSSGGIVRLCVLRPFSAPYRVYIKGDQVIALQNPT